MKINFSNLNYFLSFLFPIILLSGVFILFRVYPFGDNLALLTDLYHQYIHYYSYIIEAIKGSDSLLYSWNAGLGSNFIGNIAYYTASPILFILFLFPEEYLPEAVLLIIMIKIGLCGLSANFFIRKTFTRIKLYEATLFSAFYALMSYNISYYYNLMWLDGVILLPLIILSVDLILRNKSVIPYILLLSIMFLSNFYISYIIGLFIFLYFIIDLLKLRKTIDENVTKIILMKFLLGTLISIGISSFLTVPTFFQLMDSIESVKGISNSINKVSFLKFLVGVYDSVKNGSPNIYIGSFVLLLIPAFFTSKINRHEKIKWGTLLIILSVSFVIPPLNLLWHAGDTPNWFPFRYSFIFSFVLFYISLRTYDELNNIGLRLILVFFSINIIFILIAAVRLDENSLIINLITLTLFFINLYIKKFRLKWIGFITLILFTLFELLFNCISLIANEYKELGGLNRSQYTIYSDYKEAVNFIKKTDPMLLYRIETDLNKTNNDSLTLGHSSLSHSSSMLNNDIINTLGALGFYSRKANYNSKGSTILTDSLFGVKYFISSDEIKKRGFKMNSRLDNLSIYKNMSYLPVGYSVNKNIEHLRITEYRDPFKLQNQIFQTLFTTKDSLFSPISPERVEFHNAKINYLKNEKKLTRIKKETTMSIKYIFNITSEVNINAYFTLLDKGVSPSIDKNLSVFLNGVKFDEYYVRDFKGILEIGTFENEKVVFELQFNEDNVVLQDELFYSIDTKIFYDHQNAIDRESFKILQKEENTMKGRVSLTQDNQLLFLSIPWDDGWRVTIDGQKVPPIKVLGAFMGIPLKKGEYELRLTFIPKGLILGSIISIFSLLILIKISTVELKKKKVGV
jgi:uncharacterized membrane protein YfhO